MTRIVTAVENGVVHANGSSAPVVAILAPAQGEVVAGRDVTVIVNAGSPHGIARVEVNVDGEPARSAPQTPCALAIRLPRRSYGAVMIEAVVYDAQDNRTAESVEIQRPVPVAGRTRRALTWLRDL